MGRPPIPLAPRYGCLEVVQRLPKTDKYSPATALVRCTACGANHTYQVQNLRLFKGNYCRACPDNIRVATIPKSAGPIPTWFVVMNDYVRTIHAADPWLYLQPDEAAIARLYRGSNGKGTFVHTATVTPENHLPLRNPAFRVPRDIYEAVFKEHDPYVFSQAFPTFEAALQTWITSNPAPPSWSCSPLNRHEVWLYPDPHPQPLPQNPQPLDPYGP